MKMILFIMALSTALNAAIASTVDSQTFRFDGASSETSLELNAEETRTEYRYDRVLRTGYRTVVVGYRRICSGPVGGPTGPRECWNEPIYRTEPYSYYETIRVPYEVFENYVEAKVTINFGAVPAGFIPNENIIVTLKGDVLSLRSTGTKTLILELASLTQNRSLNGNVESIEAVANVKFHEAAPVKRALVLTKASVQKSVLTYNLGPIAGLQLAHSLKIVNNPLLGGSNTLFDAELGSALAREERADSTALRIAFSDLLGRNLGQGRYNITAKAFFKAGVSVLNDADLGGLSVEKNILYKIR